MRPEFNIFLPENYASSNMFSLIISAISFSSFGFMHVIFLVLQNVSEFLVGLFNIITKQTIT